MIDGNGEGIEIYYSDDVIISNNTIQNANWGIYKFEGVQRLFIFGKEVQRFFQDLQQL